MGWYLRRSIKIGRFLNASKWASAYPPASRVLGGFRPGDWGETTRGLRHSPTARGRPDQDPRRSGRGPLEVGRPAL